MVRKFDSKASYISNLPVSGSPIPSSSLMASPAIKLPTTPTTGPKTPISAQLGADAGGSGNKQR
jgi:hypothetical protein